MRAKLLTSTLFALCSLFMFSSCDSEEDNLITTDGKFYFEADMDGKSLYLPEGKDGYMNKPGASSVGNGPGCVRFQTLSLSRTDIRKSIQVSFIKSNSNCPTVCSEDMAMIKEGTYPFGKIASIAESSSVDGIVLSYTDVDGKIWRTDLGLGQQTNSNFVVTNIEENKKEPFYKYLVSVEFNCTLYDGEGNEIEVTVGKIVSRAVLCN